MNISYNDIVSLFDTNLYDFSYLFGNEIMEVLNFPTKFNNNIADINYYGNDIEDDEIFLVAIKYSPNFDYTLITDFIQKCKINFPFLKIEEFFCNYKYAAMRAGLGRYAKNSLIYHPVFEFDTHIAVFRFLNYHIVDLPIRNDYNANILEQCNGCFECQKACPVNAIHYNNNFPWVDMYKCDHFCFFGDDEKIPSIKRNWFKINGFDISEKDIEKINSFSQVYELTKMEMGLNSFVNGQLVPVIYPVCRECTSQKCTKYNKKYPYNINNVIIYK